MQSHAQGCWHARGQHLGACLHSQCSSQLRSRIGKHSLQLHFQLARNLAHDGDFCLVPHGRTVLHSRCLQHGMYLSGVKH